MRRPSTSCTRPARPGTTLPLWCQVLPDGRSVPIFEGTRRGWQEPRCWWRAVSRGEGGRSHVAGGARCCRGGDLIPGQMRVRRRNATPRRRRSCMQRRRYRHEVWLGLRGAPVVGLVGAGARRGVVRLWPSRVRPGPLQKPRRAHVGAGTGRYEEKTVDGVKRVFPVDVPVSGHHATPGVVTGRRCASSTPVRA